MQYSPSTPRTNQHSPLGRLTPLQKKKTWTINKEPKTNTHQRDRVGETTLEKGGRARSWSPTNFHNQKLERQEGWKWTSDKLLPEIGQVAVHKVHLLSQWATSKVKQHCKIEKQSANHHNTLTAGGRLMDHWLFPEKRGEAKKQAPSNQAQWKLTPKQDSWWATELIPEPEDNIQT
jgi:hypothetical protein